MTLEEIKLCLPENQKKQPRLYSPKALQDMIRWLIAELERKPTTLRVVGGKDSQVNFEVPLGGDAA